MAQTRAATAAAVLVVMKALAARPSAAREEPALKPNHPNQTRGADEGEGKVMRREGFQGPSLSYKEGRSESGHSGIDVDDRSSREVEGSHFRAIRLLTTPYAPMGHR